MMNWTLLYFLPGIGRFRANYYRTLGETAAAFRIIPIDIPSLDDLGSPQKSIKNLSKEKKDLFSSQDQQVQVNQLHLAAMLNEINMREHKHVVTVEDPVEFIHQNKKCVFSHRGVGEDTKSFSIALKYAMRQDPDIILIGEMRDKETIEAALTAAETGHLVFGTLHTSSAAGTINRIIDVFTGDEQPQIRAMISTSLVAVVAQALIPKLGGGRVAASEILVTNHAISNLIREDKVHQIYSQMQLGQEGTGMITQTQALLKFIKDGKISRDIAFNMRTNQRSYSRQLSDKQSNFMVIYRYNTKKL